MIASWDGQLAKFGPLNGPARETSLPDCSGLRMVGIFTQFTYIYIFRIANASGFKPRLLFKKHKIIHFFEHPFVNLETTLMARLG